MDMAKDPFSKHFPFPRQAEHHAWESPVPVRKLVGTWQHWELKLSTS